jgi:hypothetical protein
MTNNAPDMPTEDDAKRSRQLEDRWFVLNENWDDIAYDYLKEHIDEDRLAAWGIPDTSVNPLADISRQLTTPGLYSVKRPTVRVKSDSAKQVVDIVGPNGEMGYLEKAGYFTKMRHVQYLAVGLGDAFIRFDARPDEGITCRIVRTYNLYLVCDPDDPDRIIEIWERRKRIHPIKEEEAWFWDKYSIKDPEAPYFKVVEAKKDIDFSNYFLPDYEEYPYRDSNGKPFLPFVQYKSEDTNSVWNDWTKRGAYRGTLNSMLYWTYTGRCARDATGSMILLSGAKLPQSHIKQHQRSSNQFERSLTLTPGAIVELQPDDSGVQPSISEISSAVNLPELSSFSAGYEQRQAVRMGLNPSDIERQHANPTSGAALFISNKAKRDFSEQVASLFYKSDMKAIRMMISLLRLVGLTDALETDISSISYYQIPDSPQEEKEKREKIQWQVDNLYLSKIEAYKMLNPGINDEDAKNALIEIAVQNKILEEEIALFFEPPSIEMQETQEEQEDFEEEIQE